MNKNIQEVRGLSIILVILYHFSPVRFPYGYIGVDLFFMISGYIISYKLTNDTITHQIKKRFQRIYPNLYLIIIIINVIGFYIFLNDEFRNNIINSLYASIFISNLMEIGKNSYFQKDILINPYAHMWSLAMEMQFYIIIFSLHKIVPSNKIRTYIICSLIVFSLIFCLKSYDYYNPICRIWIFLLGILIYNVFHEKFALKKIGLLNKIIILPAISLISCSYVNEFSGYLVIVFCIIYILTENKNNALLIKIGNRSYIYYLIHWPILSFHRIITGEFPSFNYRIIYIILIIIFGELIYISSDKKIYENLR